MAVLRARRRNRLRKSQFGLPGSRKYPVHDRAHASNAKARATQQYKKGRISKSTKNKIHAKANRVLKRGRKRSSTSRASTRRTRRRRTTSRRRR